MAQSTGRVGIETAEEAAVAVDDSFEEAAPEIEIAEHIAEPEELTGTEQHVANIARSRHASRLSGNPIGNLNWEWIRGSNLIKRLFG